MVQRFYVLQLHCTKGLADQQFWKFKALCGPQTLIMLKSKHPLKSLGYNTCAIVNRTLSDTIYLLFYTYKLVCHPQVMISVKTQLIIFTLCEVRHVPVKLRVGLFEEGWDKDEKHHSQLQGYIWNHN